jgi:hypothetical protein
VSQTIVVVIVSSPKFLLKFLHVETLSNPRPKFVVDPMSSPPLTTFVLGATTISTHVVIMTTIGD